jgi:hypothetical protein
MRTEEAMYATDKQIGFIKFLAGQKGFEDVVAARTQWDGQINGVSSMPSRDASEMIDWLKLLPTMSE